MLSFPHHPNTEVLVSSLGQEASQRPLGATPRTSELQASELRQLKTEVQTMVYRDTQDAALYSEKHPFSLKRRRHLNFFKMINFIMAKWRQSVKFLRKVPPPAFSQAAFQLTTCSEHKGPLPPSDRTQGDTRRRGGGRAV